MIGAIKKTSVSTVAALAVVISGCHSVDDDRIPPLPVYVQFQTRADWDIYGVPGATSWRSFIKADRIPANYPYTSLSMTGFGGVLLVGDIHGDPVAYDLACPYECKADVRIYVDEDLMKARCPKCGSIYEIFTNYGYPLEGPSAEYGYALQRYHVGQGGQNEFRVITR